jgi:Condensation domain
VIDPAERAANLWPLHPEQRRILHAQARAPDSSKYNVGGYVRMRGEFDPEAYCRALAWFFGNCDAERMAILHTAGAPRQQFREDATMPAPERLDFSDRHDPRAEALAWMQARMDRPLPMSDFPLFEHALIAIEPDETWYFGRHHHIIADAYAFSLKIKTVLECYAALRGGAPLPASRLGSYRGEIEAKLAYLESPERDSDLGYWQRRLASPPDSLWPVPADDGAGMKVRPVAFAEVGIDGLRRERMLAAASLGRISLLHVLMACVAVHLARAGASADLVVGVPVHNRTSLRQKRTFGVMSAIVPTRLAAPPEGSLIDIARAAAVGLADDLAHRHVPLWEIIKQVRAAESSRRPLFEVVLNYEPFFETAAAGGLEITTHELVSHMDHIPLHIRLCDFGEHQPLALRIQLMDGSSLGAAQDFADQLQATLNAALEAPEQPIHKLFHRFAVDNRQAICCNDSRSLEHQ